MLISATDTRTRQHVRTRTFHEMEIARVIDHARKIGVLEIDTHRKPMLAANEAALIGGVWNHYGFDRRGGCK
jgi:hypothetical protein